MIRYPRKIDGSICESVSSLRFKNIRFSKPTNIWSRWREHFDELLNRPYTFIRLMELRTMKFHRAAAATIERKITLYQFATRKQHSERTMKANISNCR